MRNRIWSLSFGALGMAAAAVVTVGLSSTQAGADEHEGCDVNATDLPVSGTIEGSVDSVGFMVGARWGDGVLTLPDGTTRKFDILGAKILETGVAATEFEGNVYNLENIDDFPGTYYGASAGVTLLVGDGEAVANNAKCVILHVKAKRQGFQLSAPGASGIEISWDDD